jgi:hypothetical protein
MDDVRENFTWDVPLALRDSARQLDYVRGIHERLVRAAESLLQALRIGLGDAHALHDVAGNVVPTVVDRSEVSNLAFVKHRDVGGAGSHLYQRDAKLLLVLSEHAERAGERLEHQLTHPVARLLHRFAQIHRRRGPDRDEVHLGLETGADHADRIANSLVLVDGVFLWNRVEQLAILRHLLGARNVVGSVDVGL